MLLATGALILIGYLLIQYLALPAVGYALLLLSLVLAGPATRSYTPKELARNAIGGGVLGALVFAASPWSPLAFFLVALGLVPWGYHLIISRRTAG